MSDTKDIIRIGEDPSWSDEWPPEFNKLYVVAVSDDIRGSDNRVWTVSPYPDRCGWETDSGCSGYGITKTAAIRIAEAYNKTYPPEERDE